MSGGMNKALFYGMKRRTSEDPKCHSWAMSLLGCSPPLQMHRYRTPKTPATAMRGANRCEGSIGSGDLHERWVLGKPSQRAVLAEDKMQNRPLSCRYLSHRGGESEAALRRLFRAVPALLGASLLQVYLPACRAPSNTFPLTLQSARARADQPAFCLLDCGCSAEVVSAISSWASVPPLPPVVQAP